MFASASHTLTTTGKNKKTAFLPTENNVLTFKNKKWSVKSTHATYRLVLHLVMVISDHLSTSSVHGHTDTSLSVTKMQRQVHDWQVGGAKGGRLCSVKTDPPIIHNYSCNLTYHSQMLLCFHLSLSSTYSKTSNSSGFLLNLCQDREELCMYDSDVRISNFNIIP